MGKFVTVDVPFTDATRPKTIPGVGGVAYFKRWFAPALAGASGDPVASWGSTDGALALTQATSGLRPALYDDATLGVRCVRFDGVDDVLNFTGLSAANAQTIAVMFRERGSYAGSVNQGVLALAAAGAYRVSSNKMNAFYSAGTAGGNVNVDRLAKVAATAGGGSVEPNLVVNDDKFHVLVLRSSDGHTLTGLGKQGSTGYGPVDVVDILACPAVLSDAEVTALLTAEKTAFPTALAYT